MPLPPPPQHTQETTAQTAACPLQVLEFVCLGSSPLCRHLAGVDVGGHTQSQELPACAIAYHAELAAQPALVRQLTQEVRPRAISPRSPLGAAPV